MGFVFVTDFVDTLNKDGKQIEALCFAHHFGLMDKIQPAAMLKAYLKEVRKAAQEMPKNGANPKVCGCCSASVYTDQGLNLKVVLSFQGRAETISERVFA